MTRVLSAEQKAAKKAYMAEYRERNAEKIAAQRKSYVSDYYSKNKSAVLEKNKVYYAQNKASVAETKKRYAEANKATISEYQKTYRDENKAELSAYYKARYVEKKEEIRAVQKKYARENKESVNARNRAWAKAHPMQTRAKTGRRRGRVRQATPLWADKQAIRDVYLEANHMQMHVDHIIPLKHPLVCGLHVWENLQLLSEFDNKAKGNSFSVEDKL